MCKSSFAWDSASPWGHFTYLYLEAPALYTGNGWKLPFPPPFPTQWLAVSGGDTWNGLPPREEHCKVGQMCQVPPALTGGP